MDMKAEKTLVLVTGGAGFIGSHTVERLLGLCIPVRCLDNLSRGKLSNLDLANPLLEFVEGDVRDQLLVGRVMSGITHVVHLAAQVFVAVSVEDPPASASHNIMGFVNVLDAARKAGVKRLVYASSAAVYGAPAELPLKETAPLAPLSPYGLEKRINEDYAAMFNKLFGFSSLGLRFFNVFGLRQDPSSPYCGVISRFVQQIIGRHPIILYGSGEQTRDFIYVSDVAGAIATALVSCYTGVCNVGRGEPVSLLQLIDTLAEIAGYCPEVSHRPPRQGDIQRSFCDPGLLRKELGVIPAVGFAEGLKLLYHVER
jgi:UDP-glucose 4-epimerase